MLIEFLITIGNSLELSLSETQLAQHKPERCALLTSSAETYK